MSGGIVISLAVATTALVVARALYYLSQGSLSSGAAPGEAAVVAIGAPPEAEVAEFVNATYEAEAPASTGMGGTGQLAEFLGSMVVTKGNVLAAISLSGQAADFANPGVWTTTEALFAKSGMQKELYAFNVRQDGYDAASAEIDAALLDSADRLVGGAPPLVKDFARGVALGIGDLANALVEITALLDGVISEQQARFEGGDDLAKVRVVLNGRREVLCTIVVDWICCCLADKLAKTPAERAKAQEVLDMINPGKQLDRLTEVAKPAFDASLAETTARLERERLARDAAAKALGDKLAAKQKARDDAFKRSLRETADHLAREKRERDDKAKSDRDKAAANLKKSNDKAKNDLKKIGDAFKNAFAPKKR